MLTYSIFSPEHLPLAAYHIFFYGAAVQYKETLLKVEDIKLKNGKGAIKKLQVGDFIYLQQNPFSSSRYAALAQQGKRILWIIHAKSHTYMGKVVEGKVECLIKGHTA
jgi:hypothetical protein